MCSPDHDVSYLKSVCTPDVHYLQSVCSPDVHYLHNVCGPDVSNVITSTIELNIGK